MTDGWFAPCGVGALLVATRLAVALRLIPWLGGRPLPWGALLAAVAALTLLSCNGAAAPLGEGSEVRGWPSLAALLFREAAIGACLGLLVRLAMAVFETAGAMADVASRAFPAGGTGPHGAFYDAVGVAAFLAMGGHRVLVAVLFGSLAAVPAGSGQPPPGLAEVGAIELVTGGFAAALAVAGPLFVAGMAADLVAALFTRAEPALAPGAGSQAARSLAVHVALVVFLGAGATLAADTAAEGLTRIAADLAENTS